MTPSAETLLAEAVAIPDLAERVAFLDRACTDAALRARLGRLVDDHFRAGSFLEHPAAVAPGLTTPFEPGGGESAVGARVGPYTLRELLGEGGMGSVYVAEQTEPVKRRVALKVVKPGMDSGQVVARFEAERQALALMDHPNIAKILDGGTTPEGRPFFVMELVRGIPITDYCDRAGLTTRKRLELFVQMCAAVQHAHQKGVIHRDIKPSNVLVTLYDGRPVPKVIDFGIAKAVGQSLTDKSMYTRFTQFVGTPLYMSPEQAELSALDVDTRADVYALGVLLYDLLTGVTPFDAEQFRSAGFDEVRRIIREDEPPRPSQRLSTLDAQARSTASARRSVDSRRLAGLLRGELDWVVMRCLEKDRNRRYESASALAADVERYLHDEPVQARPPSAWYRARKFWRRNRGPVLGAALLLLALAAGAAGTTLGLLEARSQRDVAQKAEEHAKADRDTARKAEREAKALGNFLLEHFLAPVDGAHYSDYMQNHFFFASPEELITLRGGMDMKMSEALRASEKRLAEVFRGHPRGEAVARHAVGRAWLSLGHYPDAVGHFRRAVELRELTLGPGHVDTISSKRALAQSLIAAGQPQEAVQLFEKIWIWCEGKYGSFEGDSVKAIYDLAKAHRAAGQLSEATRLLEQLNDWQFDNLLTSRPPRTSYIPGVSLAVVSDLAAAYAAAGRSDDAMRLWAGTVSKARALDAIPRPGGWGSSPSVTARLTQLWVDALIADEQLDKAVEISREAVAVAREADAAVRQKRGESGSRRVASPLILLGSALLAARRPAEAEEALRESLEIQERSKLAIWQTFNTLALLGEALLAQKKHTEAESLLLRAYEGMKQREDRVPPRARGRRGEVADRLVELYTALGKPEEVAKWRAERAKYPPEQAPRPREKKAH